MKKSELKKQLEQQKKINNIAVGENYCLNQALNTMEKHYNSHMEIAEKEIGRLNVIINYLETKGLDS